MSVPVLAIVGTLLLGASTAIELTDADPRAELWTGLAAGAAFLTAMAVSGGPDSDVLVLRARLIVGAALSGLLAVTALWQATDRNIPHFLLLLVPVFLLFTTAGLALREARVRRHETRLRELRSRHAGEEAERLRWVRDLHDETLQELAAVRLMLAALANGQDHDAQAESIAQAQAAVERQIRALRRLISQVRPLALDRLGLHAALEDLARHTREATSAEVELAAAAVPRLPIQTETAVYRVVQEALTNALRHAGARRVAIRVRTVGEALIVEVRDDGRGPPAGGFVEGHGLRGMRERADALGASLSVAGVDPAGTLMRLRVPLAGSGMTDSVMTGTAGVPAARQTRDPTRSTTTLGQITGRWHRRR